jgi:hemerythrin
MRWETSVTIVWTTDLNTGIDVIDDQHRRIVDHINQLEEARNEPDRRAIGQVLKQLANYTQAHFSFEETLQEELGYRLAAPHKASHDAFIKRVAKYQQRHDAGADISEQLHGMLTTWLLHHIKRDDAAYVSATRTHISRLVQDNTATGWLNRTVEMLFSLAPERLVPTVPVVPTNAQLSIPPLHEAAYRTNRFPAAVSRE